METIRFRGDAATRRRLMVPESFAHPAKGQLGMWALMIEQYSHPGDLVLDPMAGSGATLLAALMGRDVICVELEEHFCIPMRRSWEKMRTMPMLGCEMGQVVILRGDARRLPLPDASVGAAITSPPYEGTVESTVPGTKGYSKLQARADRVAQAQAPGKRNVFQEALDNPGAVSRRGYEYGYTRPVDAILTSPPYEGSVTGDTAEATRKRIAEGKYHGLRPDVFTSPTNVAGSRYGDGYSRPGGGEPLATAVRVGGQANGRVPQGENIGNLRNAAYWDSMRRVYAECWRVLKPGGIMALVLKGFTHDGQYVDLPGQTEALLLKAGWQEYDRWRRELWSLSFWRILQKRRDPAAWDDRLMYEQVLAFKKPVA